MHLTPATRTAIRGLVVGALLLALLLGVAVPSPAVASARRPRRLPPAAASASAAGAPAAPPTVAQLLYEPEFHHHLAPLLLPPEGLAPQTHAAQRLLFQHQHPASCAPGDTKFVISFGNDRAAGLGSHMHIMTSHLSVALELGRILVLHQDVGAMYAESSADANAPDGNCPDEGAGSFLCFLRAPSNCSLLDAMQPGADRIELRYGTAGDKYGLHWTHVPRQLHSIWEAAGLPALVNDETRQPEAVKYWYRGQAVAYLLRFNAHALREMKRLRLREGAVLTARGPRAMPAVVGAAPPFPLPAGSVSMHIRHGDKGIEMTLVPTLDYLRAAETLQFNAPLALVRRVAFLTTEDPGAVDDANAAVTAGSEAGVGDAWTLHHYSVPRNNIDGRTQLDSFASATLSRAQLTRVWWLQLLIALECDAFVGTRGSNWNRLIDELRCVWVAKCGLPFSEVGEHGVRGREWFNIATR